MNFWTLNELCKTNIFSPTNFLAICIIICFAVNYEYNTRKRYYNVSVEVNPDIFELNPTGGNEQTCDDICNSWFRCAGYIYFPEDQMCHHIMDLTVNFDTTDDVMLVPSNTSFTVVRLKEEQRGTKRQLIKDNKHKCQNAFYYNIITVDRLRYLSTEPQNYTNTMYWLF